MRKASFAGMDCSTVQSPEIVGKWWTPLIVRDAPAETRNALPMPTHFGAS